LQFLSVIFSEQVAWILRELGNELAVEAMNPEFLVASALDDQRSWLGFFIEFFAPFAGVAQYLIMSVARGSPDSAVWIHGTNRRVDALYRYPEKEILCPVHPQPWWPSAAPW
jgi:hypothetical protein